MSAQKDDYIPHPNEPWSWPDGSIPYPVEREEITEHDTYYYWHDAAGDMWYASKSGLKFAGEMETAQRRRKTKKEL